MKVRAALMLALLSNIAMGQAQAQRLRIAVIGFSNEGARSLETSLQGSLARDARVVIVERSQFQPAINGIGYSGSINLSTDEARRLGAAIGCDFFIIGKAETLTRSERERQFHQEAIAAVMFVDARGGALADFDFIAEHASTTEEALSRASEMLSTRAGSYVDRMFEFRSNRETSQDVLSRQASPLASEPIEDLTGEDSLLAAGFKPPEFLSRVKPDYTEYADRANVSATVEIKAAFRANGEVGDVEVVRWAGFGLDESAVRAVRSLKFKPATRDGHPVSVRALVRYNFRRVTQSEITPAPPEQVTKPKEKVERDLREYFKPSYRRPL